MSDDYQVFRESAGAVELAVAVAPATVALAVTVGVGDGSSCTATRSAADTRPSPLASQALPPPAKSAAMVSWSCDGPGSHPA